MLMTRKPRPELRPFVRSFWAVRRHEDAQSSPACERVLPTGDMRLVFRVSNQPIRIAADKTDSFQTLHSCVVGGSRASFYLRETPAPLCTVGIELRPGASLSLFDTSAEDLSDRHTNLIDIWAKSDVDNIVSQMSEASSAEEQFRLAEDLLLRRLPPRVRGMHPAIAVALKNFSGASDIRSIVKHSGYSHRRFIALFREAVGQPPKTYARILRFRVAVRLLAEGSTICLANLSLQAGYSDQPHLNREFRRLSGMTPQQYREAERSSSHCLRILTPQ